MNARGRGREVAVSTFMAAALARELVARYGVKPVKSAVRAAAESVHERQGVPVSLSSVERTYRKLCERDLAMITRASGDKWQLAYVSDGYVDDAMARLPDTCRRRSSWKARRPRPPFAIAIAHLFAKEG